MYAQTQAITLTASGLQIDWKILPGPFLADAAWAAADTNKDGAISDAEAQTWAAPFVSDLTIMVDSQPVGSVRVDAVHWPTSVDVLRTGEQAVTIALTANWPKGLAGRHALEVHNAYLEPNSLNWFSLTASNGLSFGRPAQNNGRLVFDLSIGGQSAALTSWTSGTPNLPGFSTSLSKLATKLTGPLSPSNGAQAGGGATAVTAALTDLVRKAQVSPYFLLTAFLLSLALGSLHALTPGHGKALVGAYLVGSQGRTRDAVLLGGIVTLTHTGSVLVLGLVTLLASHYILPSLIVPWLELISGVLVIVFGLNLLFQRVRQRGHEHTHAHPHPHVHPPTEVSAKLLANDRKQTNQFASSEHIVHIRAMDAVDRSNSLVPWRRDGNRAAQPDGLAVKPSETVNLRSLIALGVSGGLVPCPDAIAILLVAVALNRVPFGMLLIVAFSVGLAAVLIAIGLAMVRGVSAIQRSALTSRSDWLTRLGVYTPVISAIVVTGLGAGLTYNAWRSFKFSQAVSAPAAQAGATKPSGILYIASDSAGHDQLFLMPNGSPTPVQYTQDADGITGYSISPDGKTILYSVFSIEGGSSIWALQFDAAGSVGSPQKVLDCPQAECNSPAWVPDGSKVAYERLENSTDSTTIPRFSIWWLDLRTGKTQPVFQDAAFPSTAPEFSPDGTWLSYISAASNTLVAFNLEDGRTLSVPLGSQAAIPESWSPDGRALVYGNAADTGEPPPLHVKAYNLSTGAITDLGGSGNVTDFAAVWSPDGKWIAIDRNVPDSNPSGSSNQVWLVKPDGTQAHVLLNEAGASYSGLSWSPDGHLLLYSRYTLDSSAGTTGTGRFDVCSVDIATGKVTVLVPGGDIAHFLP
jgi:nickel/cobalt transporter (NicO) family protein